MTKVAVPEPRSKCPVSRALDVLGDKWSLLIVRDLFLGKTTYGDLQSGPEGIPSNILAARLKRLQEAQLIERELYQERPKRYRYTLTDKGQELAPVLQALLRWGYKHYPDCELADPRVKQWL